MRDKSTKLVIGYTSNITLTNVTFHVGETARRRVLKEKRKNVHAFIEGDIETKRRFSPSGQRITYNPYLYTVFFQVNNNDRPAYTAERVTVRGKSIRAVGIN